jgi:hypothetical protein
MFCSFMQRKSKLSRSDTPSSLATADHVLLATPSIMKSARRTRDANDAFHDASAF